MTGGGGSGDKNSTLPPPVTSLYAEGGDAEMTVSFETVSAEYNQYLSDNVAYIIVVKKGSAPTSPTDGEVIVKLDKSGAVI